jgi:hypothetical protein
MEIDEVQAAHRFVEQRLRRYAWQRPVTAVALGLTTAALGWVPHLPDAWALTAFVVVVLLHMYGFLVLVGAPARAGVIPRDDDTRSKALLWFAGIVTLGSPVNAILGPWWLALLVAGIEMVLLLGYCRVRLAADIASFGKPPRTDPTAWSRFVVYTAHAWWFTPASMITMGAGALAMVYDDWRLNCLGLLSFYPAAILLVAATNRVRPAPGTAAAFAYGVTPMLLIMGGPWLRRAPDSLAVAVMAGLAIMVIVAVVSRRVRAILPTTPAVI